MYLKYTLSCEEEQEDKQCSYGVKLRRIREITAVLQKQ